MTWTMNRREAPVGYGRELVLRAGQLTFVVSKVKGCWLATVNGPRGGLLRGKWVSGPQPCRRARAWCEEQAERLSNRARSRSRQLRKINR